VLCCVVLCCVVLCCVVLCCVVLCCIVLYCIVLYCIVLYCIVLYCSGPLVNGMFVLSTEACDDYGCPHTLEHLVFLGSEQYPYKGLILMKGSNVV